MVDNQSLFALDSVLCWGTQRHPTTVKDLFRYLKTPMDYKNTLADFVYDRLYERYIAPFEEQDNEYSSESDTKLGFTIMANMCLLIETLQSFKEGLKDSNKKSENLFKRFFQENKEVFGEFNASDFYKNIRCGILHQGEATGGWKIYPSGISINSEDKNINAIAFRNDMKEVLKKYKKDLEVTDCNTPLWDNCLLKLQAIIQNCTSNN